MRDRSIVILSASGTPALTDRRLLPPSTRVSCFPYSAIERHLVSDTDFMIVEIDQPHIPAALEIVRDFSGIVPVLLVVRGSSEDLAIQALNAGARHYVRSDAPAAEFQDVLDSMVSKQSQVDFFANADRLVGDSAPMRRLRAEITRAARCQSNVLITGETGTGKEMVAEIIHQSGGRCREPFVCLNTTAIPDSLVESELFGYDRGAFTGAYSNTAGKLASGNRGTVFFDEIGDISSSLQAKLLRALDHKVVYRLGSNKPVPLDIRVLAATNQDLEAAIKSERFRTDLYYRLNVLRLELPPLRERSEDVPLLVAHFIAEFNRTFGVEVHGFTDNALETLILHQWPGNVRELRNVVEAAFVNLHDHKQRLAQLPQSFKPLKPKSEAERVLIVNALLSNSWNKSKAAEQLRWSRMTLYRKLTRLKIQPAKALVRTVRNEKAAK